MVNKVKMQLRSQGELMEEMEVTEEMVGMVAKEEMEVVVVM